MVLVYHIRHNKSRFSQENGLCLRLRPSHALNKNTTEVCRKRRNLDGTVRTMYRVTFECGIGTGTLSSVQYSVLQ